MAARPAPAPSAFNQGVSTFVRSFKAQALKPFTEHLKANPAHFDSWMYRGLCYSILGRKDEAASDFSQAEKYGIGGEKIVAQGLKLVEVHRKGGEAIVLFKKATTMHPKEAVGWHCYGVYRFGYRQDDETASALREAIRLKYCVSAITHYYLGQLLRSNGKIAESISQLKMGLSLNPTFTICHIELGMALDQAGSIDEAIQHLLEAVELNDTQVQANQHLAKLYLSQRNYDEAVKHAAVYLGSTMPKQSHHRKESGSSSGGNGGGNGGGRGTGGANGGGGSSGDDDSGAEDATSGMSKLDIAEKTWKDVKKEALKKATYRRVTYYRIMDKNNERYIWVSRDKAGHAGSAFKVWLEKRSRIVFDSSYDENLKRMDDKHESNEGEEILIKKMDFFDL